MLLGTTSLLIAAPPKIWHILHFLSWTSLTLINSGQKVKSELLVKEGVQKCVKSRNTAIIKV